MAEWCNRHLQRGLKVLAVQSLGDEWLCLECYDGAPIQAAGQEEGMRKQIDREQLKALHAEGLDDRAIAEKLEFSPVRIAHIRRDLGLAPQGRRGKAAGNGSAKVQRTAAGTAPEAHVQGHNGNSELLLPDVTVPAAKPNGHATARVVMFEISGGNETIIAAIETVRAALARSN